MDAIPEPTTLDLQLPRDIYYQVIHTLRDAVPPVSDAPEDLVRRDNAAIAQVACLLPANADEANLAATYVGAQAKAMECLRLGGRYPGDPNFVLKCNARAAGMMREARATRSLLMRVQAERRKREADNAAVDQAAWTEHCAIGLMAQALSDATRTAELQASEPAEAPEAETIAAAEQYAIIYPQRAALIRRMGRVPDDVSFGPPEEDLVRALVSGRTKTLLALDRQAVEAHAT